MSKEERIMKIILILPLIFLINTTFAKDFICNGRLQDYARELIENDLSGRRVPSKGKCLDQKRFKYIYSVQDPIGEGQKIYTVEKQGSFRINSIKASKENKGVYNVHYSVKSKGKYHTNVLKMWHSKDKKYGCASFLSFSEKLFVYSHCQ